MPTVEQVAQAHWNWDSQFSSGKGPSDAVSLLQCAFVVGETGKELLVNCDVEGLQDYEGDPDEGGELELRMRAIQGTCPVCQSSFRIDPAKTPCSVEARQIPVRVRGQMVRIFPLTVYLPVACKAPVADTDETTGAILSTGTCPWVVVVRKGRALPMNIVTQMLGAALAAVKNEWSQTVQKAQQKCGSSGPAYDQWKGAIDAVWQSAVPSMQRVQAGAYERGGPLSLVGAWDMMDHAIMQYRSFRAQLG